MRIDAHQHFWRYHQGEYGWIGPGMERLQRDFLPADLKPHLDQLDLDGCIAVQARQTLAETRWLLQLAEESDFILGVVGWVDLRADAAEAQLDELGVHPLLKGVRHIVQDEPDDEFVLLPEFVRGIGKLARFDLTYDLLTLPRQLPAATRLVREFPEQRFVLDHLSKPPIRAGTLSPWDEGIRELARCPNASCKVSGMVTEADRDQWRAEDFRPYLDVVFEAFGVERILFGSDWPVCLLAAEYAGVAAIVEEYAGHLDPAARAALFGGNAAREYRLEIARQ